MASSTTSGDPPARAITSPQTINVIDDADRLQPITIAVHPHQHRSATMQIHPDELTINDSMFSHHGLLGDVTVDTLETAPR